MPAMINITDENVINRVETLPGGVGVIVITGGTVGGGVFVTVGILVGVTVGLGGIVTVIVGVVGVVGVGVFCGGVVVGVSVPEGVALSLTCDPAGKIENVRVIDRVTPKLSFACTVRVFTP